MKMMVKMMMTMMMMIVKTSVEQRSDECVSPDLGFVLSGFNWSNRLSAMCWSGYDDDFGGNDDFDDGDDDFDGNYDFDDGDD